MSVWWHEIAETVRQEFSDIPDVQRLTRIAVRLLLAAVLGGLIGFERERKGKAAGLRTHMLVALGAAFFVLVPQQAGASDADLSRIVQGLIAGIGFLGAGSIVRNSDQTDVNGLTTAASIWLTAAIGVAAGLGREASAVIATVLALAILAIVPRVARLFERRER